MDINPIFLLAAVYFLVPLIGTLEFSLRARRGVYSFDAYRNVLSDPQFQQTLMAGRVLRHDRGQINVHGLGGIGGAPCPVTGAAPTTRAHTCARTHTRADGGGYCGPHRNVCV